MAERAKSPRERNCGDRMQFQRVDLWRL